MASLVQFLSFLSAFQEGGIHVQVPPVVAFCVGILLFPPFYHTAFLSGFRPHFFTRVSPTKEPSVSHSFRVSGKPDARTNLLLFFNQ